MRDDRRPGRNGIHRRSVLLASGVAVSGLGALSTATSAQDDPEWPVGVPDDADEWEGDPVTESAYDDYRTLTDDAGAIEFSAPEAWDDVDGESIDLGPSLRAAPDLEGYAETWAVPGIEVTAATDLGTDLESILDEYGDLGDDCPYESRTTIDAEGFDFLVDVGAGCGGRETTFLSMAGVPDADSDESGGDDGRSENGNETASEDDPWSDPDEGGGEPDAGNGSGDDSPGAVPWQNGTVEVPSAEDAPYVVLLGAKLLTEADFDATFIAIDTLEIDDGAL